MTAPYRRVYHLVNLDSTINMTRLPSAWIGAADAARRLGVTRATLYAYVSRGFVRSQASAGPSRVRTYSLEDVERLKRRTEERRAPDKAAARALQWGMPILESAIALIDGQRLYYRGIDATELARTATLEAVASLIWTGRLDADVVATGKLRAPRVVAPAAATFIARAQASLALAAAADPLAMDTRAASVARTGSKILRLLTSVATGMSRLPERTHDALATAWRLDATGADLVRTALVLCADHELNVSSFTARCVASAGSHPYAVVTAALAALEGPRHGGASARVEALLDQLRGQRDHRSALEARLRRGDLIEGFGHPLYRDGDPRAHLLLERLRETSGRSAEWRFVSKVVAAASALTGEQPNLDFALAATARTLRLPAESPIMLFAIGRTVGWIGHAIEQYGTNQLIRPRARYVGRSPGESTRPPADP
jgi:citrate synthase